MPKKCCDIKSMITIIGLLTISAQVFHITAFLGVVMKTNIKIEISLRNIHIEVSLRNIPITSHINGRRTIAEISPSACKYSTILDLWVGSTRANNLALRTARAWSSRERSSNSRPVKAFPSVDSVSLKIPIRRQIASAVAWKWIQYWKSNFAEHNNKIPVVLLPFT